MAGVTWTNRGLYYVANNAISGSTDIRMAVFKGTVPVAGTIYDLNFLSDLIALLTEAAATNYARADLASVALAEDDTNNYATLTAAAPSWSNVAVGETWTCVAYYVEGASDAARTLLCIDEPAAPLVTNGGNVTGPALNTQITR